MCKLINEPIIVYEPAGSLPKAFIWRKRLYRISEIIGNYREPARWWKGEPLKHLIRVTASSRSESTFELIRGRQWVADYPHIRLAVQMFTHLHVHSEYSFLDGASTLESLLEKAKSPGMKALVITDRSRLAALLRQ